MSSTENLSPKGAEQTPADLEAQMGEDLTPSRLDGLAKIRPQFAKLISLMGGSEKAAESFAKSSPNRPDRAKLVMKKLRALGSGVTNG